MVIDEHSRHELYGKLEQVLGDQAATTLMEHLPPVGWADVAMKRDLDALERRMEMKFDAVDMKFENLENRMLAAFRAELVSQTRSMIFTMVGSVFTAVSLTVAAVTLG